MTTDITEREDIPIGFRAKSELVRHLTELVRLWRNLLGRIFFISVFISVHLWLIFSVVPEQLRFFFIKPLFVIIILVVT